MKVVRITKLMFDAATTTQVQSGICIAAEIEKIFNIPRNAPFLPIHESFLPPAMRYAYAVLATPTHTPPQKLLTHPLPPSPPPHTHTAQQTSSPPPPHQNLV